MRFKASQRRVGAVSSELLVCMDSVSRSTSTTNCTEGLVASTAYRPGGGWFVLNPSTGPIAAAYRRQRLRSRRERRPVRSRHRADDSECKIEVNSSIGLLQALDFDNQTIERARAEFFPKLKSADGFVGFYLLADENSGVNTLVIVWESKEAAEGFDTVSDIWQELGGKWVMLAKRESWRNDDSDRRFALTKPRR